MKKQREDLRNHLNIVDTNINLLYLMHIHDSAFPMGSYTHSFGMETYIQSDKISKKEDLLNFCQSYVEENLVYNDAIIVKEAFNLCQEKNWRKLIELENMYEAMKVASESRNASRMIGKQFLKGILPVAPFEDLQYWSNKIKGNEATGQYAIVYSIYAVNMGFDLQTTIMTFMYSSVVSLIHNGIRAIPLGQNAGIEIIHQIIPLIGRCVEEVEKKSLRDLSNHSIGLEIASMKHRFLGSRLFIS